MRIKQLFENVVLQEKIEQRGNKWVVLNSDGSEVLGKHDTKEKAQAQLAAIEISKKERGER